MHAIAKSNRQRANNEVLGTEKILLYPVSCYVTVKQNEEIDLGPAKLHCYNKILLYMGQSMGLGQKV